MTFGGNTVVVVTVSDHPTDKDRYNHPLEVRTEVSVKGCRWRPLTFQELTQLGDISTERWRLTAPPVPAILNLSADDEVKVDGETFQVIGGPRTHPDMGGNPYKTTVICEKRTG